MSSSHATPKKPAIGKTPTTTTTTPAPSGSTSGTPSRGDARMNAASASGTASSAPNGVNRTRSIRNGAPVSARAAAAARKVKTPEATAEEDAKAEMHAAVDELQQKLQHVELAYAESQKQAAVLQVKLDEAHKEQGMLEENVHEHTERIEELENEKRESVRARREMEQIYESERVAVMKEKEEAVAREEEMQHSMQRLKETLAQREMRAGLDDERRPNMSRHSSHRSSNVSPNPDASDRQFAPSSVHRSDSSSGSNSKLVMQKDKVIESLRLELAEVHIKLVELENMGGGRMQELQKQVYDIKMQNARLMEENESFQLLLSEKTLNGDFLRPPSDRGSRPPSRNPDRDNDGGGTSLADELDSQADSEGGEDSRRLQSEVNGLKDQNKALTLYINNIISRLLQHDQFEAILDKTPDLMNGPGATRKNLPPVEADTDKELPPPPPPKDEQPSMLQRAKSVMGGRRPRPLSQQVNAERAEPPPSTPRLDDQLRVHEDPQTAPSVPIGRAKSPRATSGHRRANSEWTAASVVTNMYRGPQQPMGPLSPGLTSPTGRQSFFGGPIRAPSSGSHVPTISEATLEKNSTLPQRDSKMSVPVGSIQSNRNSVISNPPGASGIEGLENVRPLPEDAGISGIGAERSNPSSPPRSTTSSGDKDKQSGAVMMGSKPRPLRLVQEAADEDAAKKQANRGSWFGFLNKGGQIAGGPPAQ